jgi:hypothetical protein
LKKKEELENDQIPGVEEQINKIKERIRETEASIR